MPRWPLSARMLGLTSIISRLASASLVRAQAAPIGSGSAQVPGSDGVAPAQCNRAAPSIEKVARAAQLTYTNAFAGAARTTLFGIDAGGDVRGLALQLR